MKNLVPPGKFHPEKFPDSGKFHDANGVDLRFLCRFGSELPSLCHWNLEIDTFNVSTFEPEFFTGSL
jgi:hypothetical protein